MRRPRLLHSRRLTDLFAGSSKQSVPVLCSGSVAVRRHQWALLRPVVCDVPRAIGVSGACQASAKRWVSRFRGPPLHGPVAWEVHKFGGASLADATKMRACGDLLINEARHDGSYVPTAVVVSAMKGITNKFIEIASIATTTDGQDKALQKLEEVVQYHVATVRELIPKRPDITERIENNIERDRGILVTMLKSFLHIHEVPCSAMAFVVGTGEVWSAQTLCGYLESREVPTAWLNAREVLIVESDDAGLGAKGAALDMNVTPMYAETANRLQQWWQEEGQPMHDGDPIMVITGFIASNPGGVCTTLKRSGSDHSATIFANLLKASRVTLWKEVDGIFTTDPFLVPSAESLYQLSYEEALEIAYFGGEVLHPSATLPCMTSNIPIYVRNFLNPGFEGTVINSNYSASGYLGPVKVVTYIENVAMICLDAGGWGSVPKVTQRVMGAMAEHCIKVVFMTQNSSRHSLSFVVDEEEAERALRAAKKAFELELLHGHIGGVEMHHGCSVLSVVGQGLKDASFLPFFQALGRIQVNICGLAYGSSGISLSVVVAKDELPRALRAVHVNYEPMARDMSVCVIGNGTVGSELLDQIRQYQTRGQSTAQEVQPVGVRVLAIANSKKMVLHETGLSLEQRPRNLEETDAGAKLLDMSLNELMDFMVQKRPNAVVVDCTGSMAVSNTYPKWLQRGIHVITTSKMPGSAEWDLYCRNLNAARKGQSRWLYEASVGAGLLISTIQDLLRTGDKIYRIEGVFSGTLSYIFNNLRPGKRFSDVIAEAQSMGFTEPDPRDDLMGTDVQRKVVILARECGLVLNMEDVFVESAVPALLQDWEPPAEANRAEAFIEALRQFDDVMAAKVAEAGTDVLRYVGIVDVVNRVARVELRRCPLEHPFAALRHIDNVCLFSTERFSPTPLMVQGPGTGRGVVAGGVFAGLLRLGGERS